MNKSFIKKTIILIAVLTFIFLLLKWSGLEVDDFSEENIRKITNDNLINIYIIMSLAMLSQNLLNFFPIAIIVTLNMIFFGPIGGFIVSITTYTISSTLVFLVVRRFFFNMKFKKIQKYKNKVEEKGFYYIFLARIIPIMPANVVNMVSAISSVKKAHFIVASLVGNLIYVIFFSVLSHFIL